MVGPTQHHYERHQELTCHSQPPSLSSLTTRHRHRCRPTQPRRRHGSRPGPILELVSCKAFCDFLSVLKWLISKLLSQYYSHAGVVCTTLGALGQASALGSASFSFVITLDLYLMVKAPLLKLRSHDSRTTYGRYMVYCITISIGTALVPLTNGAYGPR